MTILCTYFLVPFLFPFSLLFSQLFHFLQAEVDHLKCLFEKYIESTLNFKKNNCKELIPITKLNGVTSLCRLYDSLATSSNGV